MATAVETIDGLFDIEADAYAPARIANGNGEFETLWVKPPCGDLFPLAYDPAQGRVHEVDLHQDGTASVMPKPNNSNSIKCPHCGWHGYLDRGNFVCA